MWVGGLPPVLRVSSLQQRAAEAWRRAALNEHASIASFARASMELMAVGAPLELIARTHLAALDEVRHTELSFAIAKELDGVDAHAGPLPALAPREATIARVAQDTLVEAAIPELIAAREAHVAAERCMVTSIAEALRSIGDDEARHAELAWQILAWCNVTLTIPSPPPFASAGRVTELETLGVLEETTKKAVAFDVWATTITARVAKLRRA
jgi:hypothetical protein